MKKFLILGLIVVFIPLLGIPLAWKTTLLILTGLYIIFSSITYKKKSQKNSREEELDKVFVENEEILNKE
ncbi:hypothetical protein KKH36_00270 [Patescibacteria group bacterium]|nr:hypothetical protein [Patescibacteria group bacterium]